MGNAVSAILAMQKASTVYVVHIYHTKYSTAVIVDYCVFYLCPPPRAIYLTYKVISAFCSKRKQTMQVSEKETFIPEEGSGDDGHKKYDLEFKVCRLYSSILNWRG